MSVAGAGPEFDPGRRRKFRCRKSRREKHTLLTVGALLPSNEKYPVLRLADGKVAVRPKYEDRHDILPVETGGCQVRYTEVHNATFEAALEGIPMGSMITLRLGRLEVDWGKNAFFRDHSPLFNKADLAEAEYFYADDKVFVLPAYVRKLSRVIPRLELLGLSLAGCRMAYAEALRHVPHYYPKVNIDFDAFHQALCAIDLDRVGNNEYDGDFELGELAKYVLSDPEFKRVSATFSGGVTRDDGTFFENLDPYVILRLLGENPASLKRDLVWGFHDVIEGGWVENDEVFTPLADESKFLIVTEGSSDSGILKTALPLVAPDVADFFNFVDMKDNYPFAGTGNLVNFCKGLAAIDAQNKIVVILDNDTAGQEALQGMQSLKLPRNMRTISLPYLDAFSRFPTLGPSGEALEDVNGRAVAIECFLDLAFGSREPCAIRWTGFNSRRQAYQGELVAKERYAAAFFANVTTANYDLSKLRLLWEHILQACAVEAIP